MTFGSLFAGIGGLDFGLERAGMICRWQVEIDDYCCKVLGRHWPETKRYGDIRQLAAAELKPVDLIAGGFPCQDLSQAGKGAGIEGTRSRLWFEFARIIGVVRPRYVLIENVPGLLVPGAMRRVVGELARLGYVGCWRSLRASEFGASHLRKRVFIVAYREYEGRIERSTAYHRNGHHASGYDANRCDPHVAYRIRSDSERRRDAGIVGEAPTGESREGLQRQRTGNAAHDSGNDVAHSELARSDRSPGQGIRTDGSPLQAARSVQCDGSMADAGNGQFPIPWWEPQRRNGSRSGSEALENPAILQREQPAGFRTRSGIEESAGPQRNDQRPSLLLGAFAPGPSDPRWPYILRDRPDLAPALESPVRGVADGLSHRLDRAMNNRTKRLGRLGNAVVPEIAEWIGTKILEFERSLHP